MSNIKIIANNIIEGKESRTYPLTLDEFRELYRMVARSCEENNKKIGETHILLLTESAIIRFSIAPNIILRINHNKNLSKRNFEVVISPIFEGNIKPVTWAAFLWTELLQNWWVFALVSIMFYFFFYKTNNSSGVSIINEMLVNANSLFISIFVLFTISQNRDLLSNKELVRKGITHQLMQNDYYITTLAIFSLALAFASISILTQPTSSTVTIPFVNYSLPLAFFAIILTHIALISLIDCFISVTKYYLKIMRTGIEGQMYTELMGEHLEKKKARSRPNIN